MLCYTREGNISLQRKWVRRQPCGTRWSQAYPGGDVDGGVRLAPSLRLPHTLLGVHAWELLVRGHVILGLGEF